MTAILLIAGAALLIVGAELLVRGASSLASAFGISPLIIGLTVVAFGTSSPELAVSLQSAASGQADIAVGNVVGSNIFNVLFILGVSALITPLIVSQQLIRLDVPLMIGASLLLLLLAWDGTLSKLDGAVLFAGIIGYIAFLIRQSRRESTEIRAEYEKSIGDEKPAPWYLNTTFVFVGLGLLVLGSRWLVTAAVEIAQMLGVSELVIGLTIVAAGTSLPEVATSILASIRGERDIAVGNVIGSNLFNILAVLGGSALLAPGAIPVSSAALSFDLPIMTAVAIACLPIFFTGYTIARWEGVLFLGGYVAYTVFLVLQSAQHSALSGFSNAMLWIVLPLIALTLAIVSVREFRQSNGTA